MKASKPGGKSVRTGAKPLPAGAKSPDGPGLRQRKLQETRERLTRAAMALFLERGFEAATIDDIAAAADVSRRSFFHYFASKEDVVAAWQEDAAFLPGPLPDRDRRRVEWHRGVDRARHWVDDG